MRIRLWSFAEREDFIKQLEEKNQPWGQQQLEFQGENRLYKLYKVELGFPCYRLANGRTQAAQREIIALEGLADDFFEADPDSPEALAKQDEILRGMVTGGTDSQIWKILRQNRQTQPLVLDSDGYVVNGNRRLCAMRLLFEESPTAYFRFQHVQVLFLPPCTKDDIDELEARLQWQPDGRSDYSWVDKAIVLRQRQNGAWSIEKIADFYQMPKQDVQKYIAMLEDAEAYLDTRGQTGRYSRVLKMEYAFEQLNKNRKKCGEDEPKKRFFTNISYAMLDDSDGSGRLYERIPEAKKYLDHIAQAIREELERTGYFAARENQEETDDLGLLGEEFQSAYEHVAPFVQDVANASTVRDIVRDQVEERQREERERVDAQYCLREAQKACTALQNVRSNLGGAKDTTGLLNILDNLDSASQDIRKALRDGKG